MSKTASIRPRSTRTATACARSRPCCPKTCRGPRARKRASSRALMFSLRRFRAPLSLSLWFGRLNMSGNDSFLDCLLRREEEAPDEVLHVTEPVNRERFEVTAVLQKLEEMG